MTPLPPRQTPQETERQRAPETTERQRPPETAEHWRRANRWLARAALVAGGFLLGALVALVVVAVDPTARDAPDRPKTVTVTKTATTTTEAAPTVPDVSGQEPSAARDVLEGAGYDVAVQEESLLCAIDAGLCEVVGQDPPAGTSAPAGSQVTIVIDNT